MKKDTYLYNAFITNVVDGDTVDAEIDLGFNIKWSNRLRLNGIDTPELHSSCQQIRKQAVMAKEYLASLVLNQNVTIQSFGQEKFGRYLADIYVNGEKVNQVMIDKSHALPYFGGKKK
jgi:micrococcal nuclease